MRHSILFAPMDPFPPFRPDVEQLVGKELPRHGYRVDYVGNSKESGALIREWPAGTAFINHRPSRENRSEYLIHRARSIKTAYILIKKIVRKDYGLILVKDKFLFAVIPLLAAKISGRPFCYWLSYPFPEYADQEAARASGSLRKLYNWLKARIYSLLLYNLILKFSAHIFAQSDAMARSLVDRGVLSRKMSTLPMGVSAELIRRAESRPQQESGGKKIAYLGSLDEDRGIPFILELFRELRMEDNDLRMMLIGGALEDGRIAEVISRVQEMGLDEHVEVTGQLKRDDAWDLVRSADVCISPIPPNRIFNVSFPTKCVEYMALGKPVVANDIPAQRELIKESGGGECVAYKKDEFVTAIRKYLKDRPAAGEAGKNGKRYVLANYSYEKIGSDMACQLERIINEYSDSQ